MLWRAVKRLLQVARAQDERSLSVGLLAQQLRVRVRVQPVLELVWSQAQPDGNDAEDRASAAGFPRATTRSTCLSVVHASATGQGHVARRVCFGAPTRTKRAGRGRVRQLEIRTMVLQGWPRIV